MCWSRIVLQKQCDLHDNEDQIGSLEREFKRLKTPSSFSFSEVEEVEVEVEFEETSPEEKETLAIKKE